jgi:hypothetical protein
VPQYRNGPILQPNTPALPEPQLYVDPTMRLPTPQPIKTPSSPYNTFTTPPPAPPMIPPIAHPYEQNGIPLPPNRAHTDGFGLLLEAYNHQSATAIPLTTTTCPTPPLAHEQHIQTNGNTALYMAPMHDPHAATAGGLLPDHYFSPPSFLPPNDGYESELQFFVDGSTTNNTYPAWGLPNTMMYSTY